MWRTMLYVDTGKRIKDLRIARGLKQKDLARLIGVKPPSLSELETGKSKEPSGPVLAKLCRVLETNQDYLLTGKGDPGAYTPPGQAQTELAVIWEQLPAAGRAALLAAARGMRDAYAPPSDAAEGLPNAPDPTH